MLITPKPYFSASKTTVSTYSPSKGDSDTFNVSPKDLQWTIFSDLNQYAHLVNKLDLKNPRTPGVDFSYGGPRAIAVEPIKPNEIHFETMPINTRSGDFYRVHHTLKYDPSSGTLAIETKHKESDNFMGGRQFPIGKVTTTTVARSEIQDWFDQTQKAVPKGIAISSKKREEVRKQKLKLQDLGNLLQYFDGIVKKMSPGESRAPIQTTPF